MPRVFSGAGKKEGIIDRCNFHQGSHLSYNFHLDPDFISAVLYPAQKYAMIEGVEPHLKETVWVSYTPLTNEQKAYKVALAHESMGTSRRSRQYTS